MRKEGASADAAVAPTSEKEAIALLRPKSPGQTGPDLMLETLSRGSALHETMYGLATL